MDTKKIEAVKMIIEAVGEDENRGLQKRSDPHCQDVPEIFAGLGQTAEKSISVTNHLKSLITIWWLRRISSSIPCVSITFTILWKSAHCLHSNGRVAGL